MPYCLHCTCIHACPHSCLHSYTLIHALAHLCVHSCMQSCNQTLVHPCGMTYIILRSYSHACLYAPMHAISMNNASSIAHVAVVCSKTVGQVTPNPIHSGNYSSPSCRQSPQILRASCLRPAHIIRKCATTKPEL